ncbi:MAG: DUF1015 domain-containing protein [Candidatus Bipolaricaulis sp.]|nr:DUF1015 domain-containing protein [Candidatus Bipolaricaulis sp.]
MAEIRAFRGVRYDPKKIGSLTDVVTPPYDRVPEDVQTALYARSPLNMVRIIKGRAEPGDDERNNVYTRAARTFQEWLASGVLVRDPEPSLYVYHQEYTFAGERLVRKGVMGLAKLEPEKVHAHEKTLKGPKEDRLKLMRASEANFEHVFMLYNDAKRAADRALAAAIADRTPDMTAEDADRNQHRVWRISDPKTIAAVETALRDKDLYIADGHHRYETSVNYMRECRERGWTPAAPESFDTRLMTLFNVAEPGMSIRPIHRMVHGIPGFEPEVFLAKATERFAVARSASFEDMEKAVRAGSGRHTFGFYARGVAATLQLRDERVMDELIGGAWSNDYRRLDVSILHAAILEPLLGIDAKALEDQTNINYSVTLEKGKKGVESGTEQMFFLLNATSADEVVRVADHGEKMPQKSTDFYPKLLTGLVFSKMEIRKP